MKIVVKKVIEVPEGHYCGNGTCAYHQHGECTMFHKLLSFYMDSDYEKCDECDEAETFVGV